MKVLLAGPGTGKTTRVKTIVDTDFAGADRILILSFTNATVQDLRADFTGYQGVECYTLHSYALRVNHQKDFYILEGKRETPALKKMADDLDLDFPFLCSQLKCITFDAMVASCLQFLQNNPAYARDQIGELDLLIVDEYQDFNGTERLLVEAISEFAADTIILGDDDQSIYGFKDADPDGIIELYNLEGIDRLKHENICHRCPDVVVERAANLIAHNRHRVKKPWRLSGREGEFAHRQFITQQETNEFIVSEIRKNRELDPDTTFLVLSSVRFYTDQLLDLLSENEIEFVDFWGSSLETETYSRVWWLRAIYSHRKLLNLIFLSRELTAHYRRRLKGVLGPAFREGMKQSELVATIAGFYNQAFSEFVADPPVIDDFVEAHVEFAEIVEELDRSALERSLDELLNNLNPRQAFKKKSVNVMSIHKSKGLQADVVFINGLVDGVLPNETTGLDTIEAQRRLLFVGLTRTCRLLYLLSPVEWEGRYVHRIDKDKFNYSWRTKTYRGQTSEFVHEMF